MSPKLKRTLPIVLGLALLILLIWVAGPYLALLRSQLARWIATLVVVLVGCAWFIFQRVRAKRNSDKLAKAVIEQSSAAGAADVLKLRERFEDAVATLKQRRRGGGQTLYELPWYVIVGPPGSGKTTALLNSGLHFPLEQGGRRGALKGIGGTRNCDWWFTDEAVFLDTAGRYLTQDSDAAADSAGWREFLSLLKKYRKRRPLNGVILTTSAHDLLTGANREAYVDAARRRLSEVTSELRIQLPVYLMVTKCDLVAGFNEYFDDLSQQGRAQVWGVTFPYEVSLRGDTPGRLAPELDALVERLDGRLFARLEEERDTRRRTKIFGFPQQMHALGDLLERFVRDVFTTTRFDQKMLLRGVYFTSGTQAGTPVDRILATIGRRFALAPESVPAPTRGKAYFIERLLKEVLFAESGLAGVNRRLELQKAAVQFGAYVAMACTVAVGALMLTVSFTRNRNYLSAVGSELSRLADVPPVAASASLDTALPRLDAVKRVFDAASRRGESVPWSMRWGLYQGSSVAEAARDAYGRELSGALLQHVASRFGQRMIDYRAEPEKLYAYLKAYLMLAHPEHMDKPQLLYLASREWDTTYGGDPPRRDAVAGHFQALLDSRTKLRPISLDRQLVTQAGNMLLRSSSMPVLVYGYIRIEYARDTARALRFDQLLGIQAERVFQRKSRKPLSEPFPAIYTKPVFDEITGKKMSALVAEFQKETWVWSDVGGAPAVDSVNLFSQVLDVYEKDYIRAWDAILADFDTVPLSSLQKTKDSLAILGDPASSPMSALLKILTEHTDFTKKQDPGKPADGKTDKLKDLFEGVKEGTVATSVEPGAQITKHFASYHRLVAGPPGAAPLDGVMKRIGELQQKAQPLGGGIGNQKASPQVLGEISDITVALQREVQAMPPVVGAMVMQVANGAAGSVRGSEAGGIVSRYQEKVVSPCKMIVGNRYPFFPGGPDLPLRDFGRLFGQGGIYDLFFNEELRNLVDTRSPWRWLSDSTGRSIGAPTAMLRKFESVERIRKDFLPSGLVPALSFSMTVESLTTSAKRFVLEVDGQPLTYQHDAPRAVPMTWPGPKPGAAAATFYDLHTNNPSGLGTDGEWAFFKLMDAAQATRTSDTQSTLTFRSGPHTASVRIGALTIDNPFGRNDLQSFRCE